MNRILLTVLTILTAQLLHSQYYFRGEVKDAVTGRPLSTAEMLVRSTGYLYYTGSGGAFGITSSRATDTVTISLNGFITSTFVLQAGKFEELRLPPQQTTTIFKKDQLLSFTRNFNYEESMKWTVAGETYSSLVENSIINAEENPETSFAIHTDKASYSNIRRFLKMETKVPPDAVRAEEMLNYFNMGYVRPAEGEVFGFRHYISECPWNKDKLLLYLQVCSRQLPEEEIVPSNLVFLIDISGSMDMPNRLPLLKNAFKLLVDNLREKDTVSIVIYGSGVGIWLHPTSGAEKEKIRESIESLNAGGATAGASGLQTAYALAKRHFIAGGNNRVILATDGDFNVGQTSEKDLENLISQHSQSGIYLTCLGVGMGNYKDSKLEVLAKKGNGNFAYLDDEKEAEKVLVTELTQTLYTVADDAYLTITFNPQKIKDYRLIGYENKLNALADTTSRVEGGEVGPGHTMLVVVEFTPEHGVMEEKVAEVKIEYLHPSDSTIRQAEYTITDNYQKLEEIPQPIQFASAVALFSGMLKESAYFQDVSWQLLETLAAKVSNPDNLLEMEMLKMIGEAKRIYSRKTKKRSGTFR